MKLFVAAWAALLVHSSCWAQSVQVFTDQAHPVIHAETLPVIYLDASLQVEEQMSLGLSADPYVAEKQIRTRLNSPEWKALQDKLNTAYTGVVSAWHLGVMKLPAVVVDSQYVVYGEPDVLKATQMIAAYRKAQR